MTPIFGGEVRDGKLNLYDREGLARLVTKLEGKRIELVLRKHKTKRSNPQNRYLHGVVIPILAAHCGYDPEEMKEALKWRFLRKEDGRFPTVRSTANLSVEEMTEFIDHIHRLAAELGVYIPSPGDVEC